MDIGKRLAAECAGTALLLAIAVGAGFSAARLAGGDPLLAMAAASLMSCTGLAVLILTFGPVSGGLFNPVLTLSEAWRGSLAPGHAAPYIAVQLAGACAGTAAAHAMFGMPLPAAPAAAHAGAGPWLAEFVATFGLLAVFIGCGRSRPAAAPFAVAAYVLAACWFSAPGAHMNPAITMARLVGGAMPLADAAGRMLAQLGGAASATALFGWLYGSVRSGTRNA